MSTVVGENYQQHKSEILRKLLQLAKAIFPSVKADLRVAEKYGYIAPIAGLRAVIECAPFLLPYTSHIDVESGVYLKLHTSPRVSIDLGEIVIDRNPAIALLIEPTEEELEKLRELLPGELKEFFQT